ncbi:monocarboxylate transporter 3 [Nilaparvata lugens]|uniref:monocarboxylate transporter 3 n=1 Tax=Nilaparvata lugens TaxID=108931 RepID=UPI00193D9A3E|nr:monocarboxylate transporter 3 [Nilaparvata lugens]
MSTTKINQKPVRVRRISGMENDVIEESVHLVEPDEIIESAIPSPPDGGYGWVIVLASFMCNMIVDGIAYTFGVVMADFVAYYGVGKGTVAWVGSLLSGMYLCAGPVVSALTNKYGCRATCIAGSIIGCLAFVLSIFSPTIEVLMITYGIIGGIGFGFIYLPAIVCVGYYFETKRSLATGIAVCGSGVGTFLFAPFATFLLETYDWKGTNLILGGLILNCAVFGALMRPLEAPKNVSCKPLLQRMADEKRIQMRRGSVVSSASFSIVKMADGTIEKRMKPPPNVDPGVHSSFELDRIVPVAPPAALPTITEVKTADQSSLSTKNSSSTDIENEKNIENKLNNEEKDKLNTCEVETPIRRNSTQFILNSNSNIPRNDTVINLERVRRISNSERNKSNPQTVKLSRSNLSTNGDSKNMRLSVSSNNEMDNDGSYYVSKTSIAKKDLIRPMSRKDIFYSGSVINLPEFQSQRSIAGYRASVISLSRRSGREATVSADRVSDKNAFAEIFSCCALPDSMKSVLASTLDVSLLKDPVFMMVGVSSVFGMAGLFIPFFFLVDAALKDGIPPGEAAFLLSIIGMTNIVARILIGWLADFPWVNSMLFSNLSLLIGAIAVGLAPFCHSYNAYVIMSIFFGIAVAGFISLTSITLVDLLGLDKLTNAFGLLILFRGVATIFGSPLAGIVYDITGAYDIPFFMAGSFFLISTITGFIAPVLKQCLTPEEMLDVPLDVLSPIGEDDGEDEEEADKEDVPKVNIISDESKLSTVEVKH